MQKDLNFEELFDVQVADGPRTRWTEAERLMDLGRQGGWRPSIVGRGPVPEEAFRDGDWVVVPATEDSSEVPAWALERIQSVYREGFRPVGWLLIHEAPAGLLPGPVEEKPSVAERLAELRDKTGERLQELAEPAGELVKGTAKVVGTIAVAGLAAAAVAAVAIPAIALFAIASGIDPILVAVVDDGGQLAWVEIARWDLEE